MLNHDLNRNLIVMAMYFIFVFNRKLMIIDILIPKCYGAMTGKNLFS